MFKGKKNVFMSEKMKEVDTAISYFTNQSARLMLNLDFKIPL